MSAGTTPDHDELLTGHRAGAPAPASPTRAQAFRDDVAAMHLRDPAAGPDRLLKRASVLAMVVAAVIGVVAIIMSSSTNDALNQRDAIVLGLFAVTLSVIGAAVFVRYSLASFMRFWMARLTFEQATQTDRLIEVIDSTRREG
ncbi:MAG: hypothetical protein JWO37_1934 [Acidimicrobiales bacterium]|jgi:hypothetical protein|nr:hypothetical protein [Acidimicrobiales bacterium]